MSTMNIVILALSCAMLTDATLVKSLSWGRCPSVAVENNFNTSAYLGVWYEYARSLTIFEVGGSCVKAEYWSLGNGSIGVRNEMYNAFTGDITTVEGTAAVTTENGDAKLEVNFPPSSSAAPYWVLGTNYTDYSVVWGCNNIGFISARNAWILTRERSPSAEVIQEAYTVLANNGIDQNFVTPTDQENCLN